MADLRDDIVTVCQVLVKEGLVKGFGHVSARLPGGDRYLITPKVSLAMVTAGDLVTMGVADGAVVEGKGRPPLEALIHTAIYRARSDVGAIVRAQPKSVEVFGIVGRPVRPVHQFGAALSGDAPVHMNSEPITTEAAAKELAATLGDRAAVILRGNGVAVTGRTLVEAALRVLNLEESARLQYEALQLGEPIYYSADEVTRIGAEVLLENQQQRAWAYYVNRLAVR